MGWLYDWWDDLTHGHYDPKPYEPPEIRYFKRHPTARWYIDEEGRTFVNIPLLIKRLKQEGKL